VCQFQYHTTLKVDMCLPLWFKVNFMYTLETTLKVSDYNTSLRLIDKNA